jgi:DNA-binding beta-propeller fold protein YncE
MKGTMSMYYRTLFILSVGLLVSSCTSDPSSPETPSTTLPSAKGVYVLHEGAFGDATGARLAFYDITRDTVALDVVEAANSGAHLGSTGDDMVLYRDRLYVLMSGSENIVALSTADHHIIQSVYFPGRTPHSMVLDSVRGRLYVTELYRNAVISVDLTTMTIVDTVAVGANPQEMLLDGDVLYVCNSGYGSDRTVSVLTVTPLKLSKTLTIGDGPTGITKAGDGSIVVACTGNPYGMPASQGSLYRIDAATRMIKDSVVFSENLWGTVCAGTSGDVYCIGVTAGSYYGGPVHRLVLSSRTLTASVVPGTFYGMAVDASSGDVYLADAKNFAGQGEVRILSSGLTPKRTIPVERGPAVFAFKR